MEFRKMIDYDELMEKLEGLKPDASDYPDEEEGDFDTPYWAAKDTYYDMLDAIEEVKKHHIIVDDDTSKAEEKRL